MKSSPNYKRIYTDLICKEFPEEKQLLEFIKQKELTAIDIIKIDNKLCDLRKLGIVNDSQKHKAYDKSTILQILYYQEKNNLNNTQTATHFRVSRNSIAKWKKLFYKRS